MLRCFFSMALLASAGFALAATIGDPPPPAMMDLGAMKLKSAPAPAAVNAPAPAPAPAPGLIPKTPAGVGSSAVGTTAIGAQSSQQTAAQNAAASTTASTSTQTTQSNQTGVGTVVAGPIGTKKAIDILAQPAANKPADTPSNSNDVQVKLPSMFRR